MRALVAAALMALTAAAAPADANRLPSTHEVSISGRYVNHWTINETRTCGLVGSGTVTVEFHEKRPVRAEVKYYNRFRMWAFGVHGPFGTHEYLEGKRVVGTVTLVDNTTSRPDPEGERDCEQENEVEKSGCGTFPLRKGSFSLIGNVRGDRRRVEVGMTSDDFEPRRGACPSGRSESAQFGEMRVKMPTPRGFAHRRRPTTLGGSTHKQRSYTSNDGSTLTTDVTRTVTVTLKPL
jgi:hypothetical protein